MSTTPNGGPGNGDDGTSAGDKQGSGRWPNARINAVTLKQATSWGAHGRHLVDVVCGHRGCSRQMGRVSADPDGPMLAVWIPERWPGVPVDKNTALPPPFAVAAGTLASFTESSLVVYCPKHGEQEVQTAALREGIDNCRIKGRTIRLPASPMT